MPTGYTAGIIDGKIKTFPEFAKLCMRAFGATIHMRDDSMDAEFVPRTPTDYHTKEIESANKTLQEVKELSDEEIINKRKAYLIEKKSRMVLCINQAKENVKALNRMLESAKAYVPPTTDHTGIKDFMIQQITETISFDGSTKYYDEELENVESELKSLNPAVIRCQMIAEAEKNISYHTKEHNEELKRCEKSNQWVADYLESIK